MSILKNAVVTGGTKGIGRAIAEMLLEKGYYVVINYCRDEESAEKMKADLAKYANQFITVKKDLSTYTNAIAFAKEVKGLIQGIDVLVLNAGQTDRSPFGSIKYESWERVMNINVNIPFCITQELNDIINCHGRVVFTGSILGVYPHSMSLAYGTSKAAVHHLAKSLVKDFANRKITANAILPGFVDTEWQKNKPEEIRHNIEKKTALGRFALPEEISKAVGYIIENEYINGTLLEITGGYCFK